MVNGPSRFVVFSAPDLPLQMRAFYGLRLQDVQLLSHLAMINCSTSACAHVIFQLDRGRGRRSRGVTFDPRRGQLAEPVVVGVVFLDLGSGFSKEQVLKRDSVVVHLLVVVVNDANAFNLPAEVMAFQFHQIL
jgi:hypothetical protein